MNTNSSDTSILYMPSSDHHCGPQVVILKIRPEAAVPSQRSPQQRLSMAVLQRTLGVLTVLRLWLRGANHNCILDSSCPGSSAAGGNNCGPVETFASARKGAKRFEIAAVCNPSALLVSLTFLGKMDMTDDGEPREFLGVRW
jgi:hypothetical protein